MRKPDNQSARHSEDDRDDITLVRDAVAGDAQARKAINERVLPVIEYQTNRLCKRFCKENRYRYRCTLNPPLGNPTEDAALCEWGNGSYGWMLDDLTSNKRLQNYQARNKASLFDYCYVIANSLPFYERWKDWRFGRSTYVPEYIRTLGKEAVNIFYGLQSQLSHEQMSQQYQIELDTVKLHCRQVIALLTRHNRLYLLSTVRHVSLSSDDDHAGNHLSVEIATTDEPVTEHETKVQLTHAWKRLSALEKFVIEALVIDDQDARTVLNTLSKLGISLKAGVEADQINRQQLYYFRRKTLEKLHRLMADDTLTDGCRMEQRDEAKRDEI